MLTVERDQNHKHVYFFVLWTLDLISLKLGLLQPKLAVVMPTWSICADKHSVLGPCGPENFPNQGLTRVSQGILLQHGQKFLFDEHRKDNNARGIDLSSKISSSEPETSKKMGLIFSLIKI